MSARSAGLLGHSASARTVDSGSVTCDRGPATEYSQPVAMRNNTGWSTGARKSAGMSSLRVRGITLITLGAFALVAAGTATQVDRAALAAAALAFIGVVVCLVGWRMLVVARRGALLRLITAGQRAEDGQRTLRPDRRSLLSFPTDHRLRVCLNGRGSPGADQQFAAVISLLRRGWSHSRPKSGVLQLARPLAAVAWRAITRTACAVMSGQPVGVTGAA